jgi:anti-anti-sigma factor
MDFKAGFDSGCATVFLEGRLSFSSYPDFRAATSGWLERPDVKDIHLDMAAVDYLDSSALGMILHLNQKVLAAQKTLAITRPAPPIATILKVVNFNKLVTILP